MRIRSAGVTLAVPIVAIGMVVAGCSSTTDNSNAGSGAVGKTSDINPQDPAALRDGGNLRLVLSSFPATLNSLALDSNEDVNDTTGPLLPYAFDSDPEGKLSVNHDYFTDIKLTNTNPQQVTYTINPQAHWSDGSPITWEDLQSEANSLKGVDKNFQIGATGGFDRVGKVERGVDDRQAVVTFDKHYAEWQGQFSPLYPKSVTSNPEAFNNSIRTNLPVTAGPFKIGNIDKGQNRITLVRDPGWWGTKPKLDTITLSVLDHSAWISALQNNEVDAVDVASIDDVKTAKGAPGLSVRRAPLPRYSHMTFNGAPGAILSDPKLRVAISKGIDREGIAKAIQNGIVTKPKALNNHVFMDGQEGFQDNASAVSYDPAAAGKMLDDLGWKMNGDVREKDGKKLELRDVMYQQDTWVQIAQIAQQNLAKIGVKLNIQTLPGNGLFTDVIDPGNYDIAQFSWSGSALPLGALDQIYAFHSEDLQGNKGRIEIPGFNDLVDKTISELDPKKAIEDANQADKVLFDNAFSLPLVQSAGNVAVRSNLANYGAFGLGSVDYTKVGFLR